MRSEKLTSVQNFRAVTSWQLSVVISKAVKLIEQQKNGGQRLNAGAFFQVQNSGWLQVNARRCSTIDLSNCPSCRHHCSFSKRDNIRPSEAQTQNELVKKMSGLPVGQAPYAPIHHPPTSIASYRDQGRRGLGVRWGAYRVRPPPLPKRWTVRSRLYRSRSWREMTHVQQVFDVIHNFDKHVHRSKMKMLAQCRLKILSESDCLSRSYSFLFSSYVVTCFSERVL